MVSDTQIIIRLLLAAILGGLVGYERQRNNQPAGLRTHIILVVGATLAMTLSINLAMEFRPLVPNGDPARLAAQVISGIGFLGAGAIIRYGANIKGLTTATSLWSMAVVGLVVGAGYYLVAAFTTGLLLITLILINFFEKRYIKPVITSQLTISAVDKPDMLNKMRKVIEKYATVSSGIRIHKDLFHKRVKFVMTFKIKEGKLIDEMLAELTELEGIRMINYE
ncbi:MAG TPA: MgtC/SapB family protein [Anaerolineaceae bacterium]